MGLDSWVGVGLGSGLIWLKKLLKNKKIKEIQNVTAIE